MSLNHRTLSSQNFTLGLCCNASLNPVPIDHSIHSLYYLATMISRFSQYQPTKRMTCPKRTISLVRQEKVLRKEFQSKSQRQPFVEPQRSHRPSLFFRFRFCKILQSATHKNLRFAGSKVQTVKLNAGFSIALSWKCFLRMLTRRKHFLRSFLGLEGLKREGSV